MELPSSSGIPCITIEEDDNFNENIEHKSMNATPKNFPTVSAGTSNARSLKIEDVIRRFNSANNINKQIIFEEVRACFAEKSQEEFSNILFRCARITKKENNACSFCKINFSSPYENIKHIVLVHNLPLNCPILVKMENSKTKSNIPKISHVDKFRRFLGTCNRSKNLQKRIKYYATLNTEYNVYFKKIQCKLARNMFDENKKVWTCNNCKKSYKTNTTLAKHLYTIHNFNLEYESDNDEVKAEVKLEKDSENRKPLAGLHVLNFEKSQTKILPLPSTDNEKKLLHYLIYLAKSFPMSNSELVHELFKKLNYDTDVFRSLTENQDNLVEHSKNLIFIKFMEYLIKDVGDSIFSIFINKWTHKNKQFLLLVIKYFSNEKNRIVTSFYRLIQIQSDNYATDIIEVLQKDSLNIEKCGGFGLDVTNELGNSFNSVIDVLKNINSRVAINKCVSQSLKVIVEKACTLLPENLAIMIKEIYEWFRNSEAFSFKNIDQKIHHYQWFTELECIQTIINEWSKLEEYLRNSMENCRAPYILQNLFQNDTNFIYLFFIIGILRPILELHNSFRQPSFDHLDFLKNLSTILQKLPVKQEIYQQSRQDEFAVMEIFSKFLFSELQNLIPEKSSTLYHMSFSSLESTKTTRRMQCLPFSNNEVIQIFDHVEKFISKMTDEMPIEIAEAFLIIRCQNEVTFL